MKQILPAALSLALGLAAVPAQAAFDGSQPLLCAINKIHECLPVGGCQEVSPEQVSAPRFIRVDLEAKQIATVGQAEPRVSPVERVETLDGKLILQGAEDSVEGVRDGLAWSIAIDQDNGQLVLSGAGDGMAFAVFGACLAQ